MPELSNRVTTAQLSDALDALGCRDRVLSGDIGPLARGIRAVGRAATLQFAPVDHDVDDAVRLANEKAERETLVLDELQSGATLDSVWARYRVL
jgi:regulator of RNase E activity RraA